MKTMLVAINSKFIHPNLAIRYLQANCDFDVLINEYTIKDSIEYIYKDTMIQSPKLIGFSVYIWNIEIIKELIMLFKKRNPEILILLGGPEVSYESDYLFKDYSIDYIIYNEGEIAFNKLLHALIEKTNIENVENLKYMQDGKIKQNHSLDITDLDSLKNPYFTVSEDYSHKIAYLELSRGCPYKCAYCLASLEKNVRFFNIARVKSDIVKLYDNGARTFKFLDRTFNIREDLAIELLEYIYQNDFDGAVFQFEINADILSDNFIDYLNNNCPSNKIRFEIGIQSTNDIVNSAVNRRQNTDRLLNNIRELSKGNVIMHLDLIAGLPYEDLNSFIKTFNTVFKLYGDELQLGFLKLLKGTQLYYEAEKYGYSINRKAPYELNSNQFISSEDLETIHIVEEMLNIYWNKGFIKHSIRLLTENHNSPFHFFLELGRLYLKEGLSYHRYQLHDIFAFLEKYTSEEKYVNEIRYEYLRYHSIKPKIYWENKVNRNDILRDFHSQNKDYKIDSLYKYAVVIRYNDGYIIAVYTPDNTQFIKFNQ